MDMSDRDRRLIAAIADGLPLAAVARAVGLGEDAVIDRLRRLSAAGVLKRFGVIVRHRELGYRANAMTVWDVPDERVATAGRKLAELPYMSLCYRRPRRPPDWPYNLFCMIHGRDRAAVEAQVEAATTAAGLDGLPRAVLFSRRRFKQRGARYALPAAVGAG
jgi:DNA-binding Lrp family transcriptional regulator